MTPNTHLHELLSRWQRLAAEGRPTPPADLCHDCPELEPELARRVEAIQRLDRLVEGLAGPPSDQVTTAFDPRNRLSSEAGALVARWVAACREGRRLSAEELCRDQPHLREEVTRLLDEFDRMTGAFGGPGPAPPDTPPEYLGRYRVDSLLGRGGFGEVWKAYDPLLLREVAIKRPRPDRSWPEGWRDGLLRKARKLASLDHPNVVRVFDVLPLEGTVLIVSALIDGPTLARHAHGRRLPPREAASIVAAVAEALHRAHLLGLVHRDVKPGNILIDRDGVPRLTDFGLAATEQELGRERPAVLGTLVYMSPEQVRGDSHRVDGRTDIYSLGVVLYELLTGRIPYPPSGDLADQIQHRPARPPRAIDDTVPAELERVCLKCLAKRVEDRYTTAADVAADLRAWLDRADGPPPAAGPWRRGGWLLALGAAALAACLAVALWPSGGTPAPKGDPPGPKPGEWQDLLEREPTVVLRPERFAHRFDPRKKELWWDTVKECLIRLGSAPGGDYEVEATFEQPALGGHRGLYFGRQQGREERLKVEFQAVLVHPDRRPRGAQARRVRVEVNEVANKITHLDGIGPGTRLPEKAYNRVTVAVRVRGGRLDRVLIDHALVEGLGQDVGGLLVGEFGVLADYYGGRLIRARWKVNPKED